MQTTQLGTHELTEYMQEHGIRGEILYLNVPTPTVETAAQAVNAIPDQIIKSILFVIDNQPVLAIACGTLSIDRRAIADIYGVGKKRVKLATPEMVLEISGYEVGAMPPFGHRQPLTTLIDRKVLDSPESYAGGGAENALVRLNPKEILRVTGAKVLNLLDAHE
jgi:prolyl-tRNA editing enzyme YbaK/EbsC (Cys-tRNA(Pro) deacylase)